MTCRMSFVTSKSLDDMFVSNRYDPETDRLNFLVERDGLNGAIDFAVRTLTSYRRAVVHRRISKEARRDFIESVLAFKRCLDDQNRRCRPI